MFPIQHSLIFIYLLEKYNSVKDLQLIFVITLISVYQKRTGTQERAGKAGEASIDDVGWLVVGPRQPGAGSESAAQCTDEFCHVHRSGCFCFCCQVCPREYRYPRIHAAAVDVGINVKALRALS